MTKKENLDLPPASVINIWQDLEKVSPDWQEFSQKTRITPEAIKTLPMLLRRLFLSDQQVDLSEEQLPTLPPTIAALEEKISQAKSNPEFAKAFFLQKEESASWQKIQAAKAFFRSPKENRKIVATINSLAKTVDSFWLTPLKQQEKTIRQVTHSSFYQIGWLAKRLTGSFFKEPEGVRREKRFFLPAAGKRFVGLVGQKTLFIGAKQFLKTGAKAAVVTGGKGVMSTLGSALGIGGGPPGWLVTATVWTTSLIKKGTSRIFSGLTTFFNNLIFAQAQAEEKSDKSLWLILVAVFVGLPILLAVLIIFGAGILGSSLWVSQSESLALEQFLTDLEKVRVDLDPAGLTRGSAAWRAAMTEQIIRECIKNGVVNSRTLQEQENCLKEKLEVSVPGAWEEIKRSVASYGKLQCVGFKRVAEPNLPSVARAAEYVSLLPHHTNFKEIKVGDNVVHNTKDGHIAVVTRVEWGTVRGEIPNIWITAADGYTGVVATVPLTAQEIELKGYVILK